MQRNKIQMKHAQLAKKQAVIPVIMMRTKKLPKNQASKLSRKSRNTNTKGSVRAPFSIAQDTSYFLLPSAKKPFKKAYIFTTAEQTISIDYLFHSRLKGT